ncbi:MAG: hypothetical protein ABDH32_00385 [Candidatus Caldarchaeales archaeon]
MVEVGRRRRKIIKKRPVRPLPKIFVCPLCNVEAVTVHRLKDEEYADVACSNCKTRVRVRWHPSYSEVDAYTEFYDIVTGAKKVEVVAESSEDEKVLDTLSGDIGTFEEGRVTEKSNDEISNAM